MSTGFALRELRLSGPGVEDAVVPFADGLNMIIGPSDTGKTYVAQCLSFLMGSGKKPKNIPQATAYDTASVTFLARKERTAHTLARRLDGSGLVQHTTGDAPTRRLKAKHDRKRSDTLPAFLLELSELSSRVVRTHVYGKTRPLAFSDVERLFVVDEETVISERSPILGSQRNEWLAERRAFRLLLTGADDAGVVALEKPEIARGQLAGRTGVLEQLLASVRADLAPLNVNGGVEDAELRAKDWAERAEAAARDLDRARRSAEPVERRRRRVLGELQGTHSLGEHRRELQLRFSLLVSQYESDLDRLALVEEAGGRLTQLAEERCPVCGASAEHQQHEHRRDHVGAAEIAKSYSAEAEKIAVLLRGLRATITANDEELSRLGAQEAIQAESLSLVEQELGSVLNPRVGSAAHALRQSEAARNLELQTISLLRRAHELGALLAEAKATRVPQRAEGSTDGASTGEAEAFSACVEELLKSWHFPGVDRVTWSEKNDDILVSGRGRATYGKGKRAIMRAAFNLALLRVLSDEQRPSPGVVLIDSPLVVYREPEPGEDPFPPAVKDHFYEAVARDFTDSQVVVFENDEPPATVAQNANIIIFTGAKEGRSGFIP